MDTVRDIVETILIAALIAIVVRVFVFEPFVVDGPSMETTLWDGEKLFLSKLAYKFGTVKRGDVVVFQYPLNPAKDYVKRCVAVGGDTVEMRVGRVYINGQQVLEPYVRFPGLSDTKAVVVPKNSIFVMGDNRTNSEDSRTFGPVKVSTVRGKAVFILWPPKSMRLIK
jgi:signal peptidase I